VRFLLLFKGMASFCDVAKIMKQFFSPIDSTGGLIRDKEGGGRLK
jgi:hypothetical protein